MSLNKLLYISLIGILLFQSCGKDDGNTPVIDPVTPAMESSTPTNGETNVDVNTTVAELVFDRKITLVSAARITLNGSSVLSATANAQILTVTLPSLVEETGYSLVIDALAIKAVDGGVNTEPISVNFTTGTKQAVNITSELAVSNPSSQTVNLYNFLKDNYGEKIISSTMANVAWNTNEAEWVKLQTGKYPAMTTFDYIHLPYSPANWIDYSNTTVQEDWWNNNGIISAGWHWIVPTQEGSTDYTYKPSETTFKASNATVDGTWENDVVKADLEKITGYLKLLQAKNIPVVWRPLHEAAGNTYEYNGGTAWFWWGASGAEAYKKLWVYMFDYFESQGLNNLIWVWTTQTKDNDFYPGDEYVDIVGRDIYNESDAASIVAQFNSIQEKYSSKMVTLSECGSVANISDQWEAGAKWSYFMPWYDYDRTNDVNSASFSSTEHQHANAAWWNNAFGQSYVITRDQMPNLK